MAHATAESKRGEVVVDGFRHRDDGQAVGEELLGDAQGAVAANRHERVQAERVEAALRLVQQLGRQPKSLAVTDFGGESSAIAGAQDRAAPIQQAANLVVVEGAMARRRQ